MKAVTFVSVRSIQLRPPSAAKIAALVKQPGVVTSAPVRVLAARQRPSLVGIGVPRNRREQGRPGARRPHGPRAVRVHGAGTTGSAGTSRPSLRDGLTAYTCSPRGPAVLPPFLPQCAHAPDTASASGCQDHTISPYAPRCSSACPLLSMILSESCGAMGVDSLRFRIMLHAATSTRPPHPAPNVRDDRETSLSIGSRTWLRDQIFWKNETRKFLREGLDRGDRLESLHEKSSVAQRGSGRSRAFGKAFRGACDGHAAG